MRGPVLALTAAACAPCSALCPGPLPVLMPTGGARVRTVPCSYTHRCPAARRAPAISLAGGGGAQAVPEPRPPWRRAMLAGVAGGLLATALTAGGRGVLLLLQVACVVWPAVSAVQLWRDGKRRAALTVALSAAARRFCSRWWQYLTIPLFAGAVGWVTNKVAVDMIFYPLEYGGVPLKRWPNQPLGLIGWQGIVPAKAGAMAERLTDMVTTKLISVRDVFSRLDPNRVAELMAPGVDKIAETVASEMVPPSGGKAVGVVGRAALRGLPPAAQEELVALRHQFVAGLTRDMQHNIDDILDLKEVMVGGFVREKSSLVDLFQRCGKVELAFLVNSGFGFGCMLGLIQMALWVFFELPWTLAAGGAAVGYLTNLIAIKLIFEPVEPTRFGPFVLQCLMHGCIYSQGLFLKRQPEVSAEFADCMTEKLLASETLWAAVLTGSKADKFAEILRGRMRTFMRGTAAVLYGGSDPTEFAGAEWWGALEARVSERTMELLPSELPRVHGYVDTALGLREDLNVNLRRLSPAEFEQVLHPVFEEEELTLILVGAALGLAVGWAQAWWDARSRRVGEDDDDAPPPSARPAAAA